jgi:CRP-like cAMP-binding protein
MDGAPRTTSDPPNEVPSLRDAFLSMPAPTQVRTAKKGATVLHEGDACDRCLFLLDGWLGLTKGLPDGTTLMVDVLLVDDFVVAGSRTNPAAAFSVEALSDVSYVLAPANALAGYAQADPRTNDLLLSKIVTANARIGELMLRLGRGSAATRIAYALLELYLRLEKRGLTRDGVFSLPMSQQRFGQFTGLSNVHVCRTMRQFQRDGIIAQPTPHEVALRDFDALCEIAGIGLEALRREILVDPTPGPRIGDGGNRMRRCA